MASITSFNRNFVGVFVLFFIVLGLSPALRAEDLEIDVDEVSVYSEPSDNSDVIRTLEKGASVPVSKNIEDGFYKILLKEDGRKRLGYIKISDVSRGKSSSRSAKKSRGRRTRRAAHFTRWGLGVTLGVNYQNQGSRRYQDPTAANAVEISSFSGLSNQFGFFVEIPGNDKMSYRAYLQFKQANLSGSATIMGASPRPTDTFLKQSFLSVGGLWKWYGRRDASTWFGGGFQIDKGTSGSITFGARTDSTEGGELPMFYYAYGSMGFDWTMGRDWVIIPEVKLGALVNSKPMTLEGDVNLNVAYSF